jgi:hypothetical protein
MYLNKIEIIDEDLKTFPAMSNAHDMAIEVWLIDHIDAAVVCELGAGTGNWSGIVSRNLNRKDVEFLLFENFKEAEFYSDIGFPKNVSELETSIARHTKNSKCFDININELPELERKADIIRLDCDGDGTYYERFATWLIENTTENAVILVDDVRVNVRPDRLFLMHELVRQGKLEFLWGGYEEAAWCKPGAVNRKKFFNSIDGLYGEYFDFVHLAYHQQIFGQSMSYLTTRPKWITDGPRV